MTWLPITRGSRFLMSSCTKAGKHLFFHKTISARRILFKGDSESTLNLTLEDKNSKRVSYWMDIGHAGFTFLPLSNTTFIYAMDIFGDDFKGNEKKSKKWYFRLCAKDTMCHAGIKSPFSVLQRNSLPCACVCTIVNFNYENDGFFLSVCPCHCCASYGTSQRYVFSPLHLLYL